MKGYLWEHKSQEWSTHEFSRHNPKVARIGTVGS